MIDSLMPEYLDNYYWLALILITLASLFFHSKTADRYMTKLSDWVKWELLDRDLVKTAEVIKFISALILLPIWLFTMFWLIAMAGIIFASLLDLYRDRTFFYSDAFLVATIPLAIYILTNHFSEKCNDLGGWVKDQSIKRNMNMVWEVYSVLAVLFVLLLKAFACIWLVLVVGSYLLGSS